MDASTFQNVVQKIDDVNKDDVRSIFSEGEEYPYEIFYARRLSFWVHRLDPNASFELLIAARGQHIGRWTIRRDRFPMDRGGYLRWREELKKFHAQKVADIMRSEGCADDEIEEVRRIILKKGIKESRDVQTMEDALCLVFLENQFDALKEKTIDEKMTEIVRKTWKKMSDAGRSLAKSIPMSPEAKRFLEKAIRSI